MRDHLSDAAVAELFGDVEKLRNQVSEISDQIGSLAPKLVEIDAKWLHARKNTLNAEFEETVKSVLSEESKIALLESNLTLKRSADRIEDIAGSSRIQRRNWIFSVISTAIITSILCAIIANYVLATSL